MGDRSPQTDWSDCAMWLVFFVCSEDACNFVWVQFCFCKDPVCHATEQRSWTLQKICSWYGGNPKAPRTEDLPHIFFFVFWIPRNCGIHSLHVMPSGACKVVELSFQAVFGPIVIQWLIWFKIGIPRIFLINFLFGQWWLPTWILG